MKIEIGVDRPGHFIPDWPGQYDIFSHYEFVCGIPQSLFAVTTYKKGRIPNVCPQSWSSFVSGTDGYYAVLGGLMTHTHTYQNIIREKCFCVNFLSPAYYDAMMRSIESNGETTDELKVCGFTPASCKEIDAPSIDESFLSLECELCDILTPASGGITLIVGKTLHASIEDDYACGIDAKYGESGFSFNIHSPIDAKTGVCDSVGVATLNSPRKLI